MIDAVVRSLTAISLISILSNQARVPKPFRYIADGGPRRYVYARFRAGPVTTCRPAHLHRQSAVRQI
jgi:hypothetical protein